MKIPSMLIAITRGVSPAIARCELTHVSRSAIDVELACAQHGAYEAALASCGAKIHRLTTEPDLPDSVFVEDTAVVLDECAVMTRPGAASRGMRHSGGGGGRESRGSSGSRDEARREGVIAEGGVRARSARSAAGTRAE